MKPDRLIAWERGTRPRDYQLVRMAPHLDVSVDDLRSTTTAEARAALPRATAQALPRDVVIALRKIAGLTDVIPAMKELERKAPDLIEALEEVRKLAGRFEL